MKKSEGEFAYLSFSFVIFLAPVLHQELVGLQSDKLLGADHSVQVIIANCLNMKFVAFSLAEMTRMAPWRR